MMTLDEAIGHLDPDGGWDFQRDGWSLPLLKWLRIAEDGGLVESGVSFDVVHWRISDAGLARLRRARG